jgi:TonB family protein
LFAFGFLLDSLDAPRPFHTVEIASNIRKVTPLYMPLELTQKAPNRGKIAKEVNAEDLLPRPASQKRLPPAPAVRTFRPPIPQNPAAPQPAAPNVTEPPKLDAGLNPPSNLPAPAGTPNAPPPPQIQPVEKPKLAFETPGQSGTAPNPSPGRARLTPPKATVDEAIRSITHSGGAEIEPPPTLAPSPNLPPSPGQLGSPLELLSDPQGVDFKPYLARILAMVRQNWFAVIPQTARMGARGTVLLEFAIDRNGQVPKLVIATTSGSQVLDKAAVASISASVPFPPLPPEYKGLSVRLQFAFKYNFK